MECGKMTKKYIGGSKLNQNKPTIKCQRMKENRPLCTTCCNSCELLGHCFNVPHNDSGFCLCKKSKDEVMCGDAYEACAAFYKR